MEKWNNKIGFYTRSLRLILLFKNDRLILIHKHTVVQYQL